MNWSATAVASGGVDKIKPFSQEEALARQDEIRQLGWFAPNREDATIDAVRVAERYWRKYCDVVGVDYKEYLFQGDEAVYMSFIDWIAAMATQKGRQKATKPIRMTGSGSASTTPYITKRKGRQCLTTDETSGPQGRVIQNATAAWDFGFNFVWNITGVPDEPSDREFFSGWVMIGADVYAPNRSAPSDPFIVVNSTRAQSVPGLPSIGLDNPLLAAGKWTLSWSYETGICTPHGDIIEIGSGVPAQGSISFTVEGGGASPDFTSSCPNLAGQIEIVGDWGECPEVGTPGTSNPCGAKIDAAQASSISAVLALSTATSSATGGSSASGAAGTLTVSGSSASGATSTSTTSANIAGREQLGSGLLGAAAGIAGLGILLL